MEQSPYIRCEELWEKVGQGAVTMYRLRTPEEAKELLAHVEKYLPVEDIELWLRPFENPLSCDYFIEETESGYTRETMEAETAKIVLIRYKGTVATGYYLWKKLLK